MRKSVPVDVVAPAIKIARDRLEVCGDTCIDEKGTTQDEDDDDVEKKINTRWKQEGEKRTGLKLKTCRPSPSFSYELLGLAYWPAIRPMRTTGKRAPQMSTREKERIYEDRG